MIPFINAWCFSFALILSLTCLIHDSKTDVGIRVFGAWAAGGFLFVGLMFHG